MPRQKHRIFINYRRNDDTVLGWTTLLHDELEKRFPNQVFRDQQDLPLGHDFPDHIDAALESCEALLVCIQDPVKWREGSSSTIHDERDWVRREIERALERGIAVLPIVFLPGGRRPVKEEIPESLHPLLSKQEYVIDIAKTDWASYQIPRLVDLLRQEMPVPKDRHILADQLFALLQSLQVEKNKALKGIALAELYLLSAGLERIPRSLRIRPQKTTLVEVLGFLKALQGDQLFAFARGCRTYFGIEDEPDAPLSKWLQDHNASIGDEESASPGAILRIQFILNPKAHWSVASEALELHGTLRLGPHSVRISSEVLSEAVCVPGMNMELVLEPLIASLVDWLFAEMGRPLVEHLSPRMEYFAARGGDPRLGDAMNWPLERVPLGDRKFGELFAVCRRIYERHLNQSDDDRAEWRRRSANLQGDRFRKETFLAVETWASIEAQFINRHCAFCVMDGSMEAPVDVLVERSYPVGFWNRTCCPEWNEALIDQIYDGEKALADIPASFRTYRNGAPDGSPIHDIAVLFDPCEDDLPHDPGQAPDVRKTTRAATIL